LANLAWKLQKCSFPAEGTPGTWASTHGGSERAIHGSHLLVVTGRRANAEGIRLEVAGVAAKESGLVQLNDRLETTARRVAP
jgi:pyruvate/2-oxoglutarate dehydrogenase complex dihydrolipoamide dehydrogenase (E3) component